MHSPFAFFMHQSKQFNHGRRLGLIPAAGTRMAGHAYAQLRMLRLKAPLLATINSAAYIDLKLKGFAKKVELFLSNPDMWHAVFVIERCLYPMIRVLRLCDTARCGGMSKILYFVHKTDAAIEQSVPLLKDLKYFDDHTAADANDVDGLDWDDGDSVVIWEGAPGSAPVPVAPKRIFRVWIEDWEWECISNNDPVAEARLLKKYGGMQWFNPDLLCNGDTAGNCTAESANMEFVRGHGGVAHYCVG